MREIGIRELKSHLSETLRAVEAGEVLRVTSHGRPVAELGPPSERSADEHYHFLIRRGRLLESSAPHSPPPRRVAPLPGRSATEEVLRDRESER
jgi:prevent-host-death family protein